MAFYYSRRKLRPKEEDEAGELNIVPYLDILMNLIIFMLLSMTGLAAMGIVNVAAPTYASGGAAEESPAAPLNLTVAISAKGFFVSTSEGMGGGGEPTIPVKPGGEYDFAALTAHAERLKASRPDENTVRIAADRTVPYQAVVETMDALRETAAPARRELFPVVMLGEL